MRINYIFNSKGQSIIEYALILGIVVIALSAMQVYVKRGIQAGIKIAADEMGAQEYAETDPDKGTQVSYSVNSQAQDTQRIRLFEGGSQRKDIDKIAGSSGGIEYISTTDVE
ncbi:hypothetical protein KKD20_06895 [Patescibacteria group bacterium]|nr:hypothetical protein [Candidatus Omnitrophota bacterium]MBU4332801.1 hypothetical protein [Patescibacteria group bacterium]